MTPRLRMLSIGLVLSLAYAIYDYVQRNSEKPTTYVAKKETKRARTAGVSKQRAIDLKKKIEARKAKKEKSNFTPEEGLLPISSEIASLEGWARNPFVEVYVPRTNTKNKINNDQEMDIDEEPAITSLDGLIIKTVVLMEEKAYVTINGQNFTEGEKIEGAVIEKIENDQITFKVGELRIIKDVGT